MKNKTLIELLRKERLLISRKSVGPKGSKIVLDVDKLADRIASEIEAGGNLYILYNYKLNINLRSKFIPSSLVPKEEGSPGVTPQRPLRLRRRKKKRIIPGKQNDVVDIFEHWNSKGKPLVTHPKGTKKESKILRTIERQLKKYSAEQIKKSIDVIYELFTAKNTSINFQRPGFKKIGLDKFFLFDAYEREYIEKYNPSFPIESWFEECLKGIENLYLIFGKKPVDNYPAITSKVREFWIKNVDKNYRLLPISEKHFMRASEQIVLFLRENKNRLRIPYREKEYPAQFVKHVFRALLDKGGDKSKMHSGYLVKDFFYNEILVKYLRKKGFWKDAKRVRR